MSDYESEGREFESLPARQEKRTCLHKCVFQLYSLSASDIACGSFKANIISPRAKASDNTFISRRVKRGISPITLQTFGFVIYCILGDDCV